MNIRCANQRNQHRPKSLTIARSRKLRPVNTIQWMVFLLVVSVFILTLQQPAWGGEFKLESSPRGIRGYAQQVALEEVLSHLAQTSGYVVQIDQALLKAPTTFYFPMPLPAERAIQRIVHPHSLALVFTRMPGKEEPVISQIKVFDKGTQSASYAMLSPNGDHTDHSSYARSGATRPGSSGGGGVSAGRSAVDKFVRPPVTITKSAMGFTGFKFKDHRRGPDYRPGTMAMAKAYAKYREERNALLEHTESSQLNSAKLKAEQQKNQYRASRNSSLQQTINDSKN